MRTRVFGPMFAVACALAAGCASDETEDLRSFDEPLPSRAGADSDVWELVLADEFEQPRVDPSLWFPRTGDLVHKHTLNSASPEMVTLEGGSLVVSAIPTPHDPVFPYTAGYLDTRGRFAQTYGKIEARVRCPYAPGLWYAVWGRPWENAVPEIDIEFLAENINQVWFVSHWALPPLRADDRRSFVTVGDIDISDFHTYSIVWTPDLVEWQIDGNVYKRVTGRGVPHEPMFWVINAWVGGWAGQPSSSTRFPARFEVDSFRVYRMKDSPVEPRVRVARPKTRYTSDDTIDVEVADFDRSASLEMWKDGELVATMTKPPFSFPAKNLGAGEHTLSFVATDGARTATTSIAVVVR